MMILRTVLSARLLWSGMRKSRYAPIRAHSRSKAAENESRESSREFIEKAIQLLGGDLAKLIHKVDPRHPLMDMARHVTAHNLDTSCKNVIVSVSKAINSLHGGTNESTVFAAQKSLAEFTGMIHKGYLLHLTVTDSLVDNRNNVGNKIAILSGDYFISKACLGLASLQNTYVVEIMSSAICDMVEGTYAQLKADKDSIYTSCSNLPNISTNPPTLSQRDSAVRKYHSYIQKGINLPRAVLQLLCKVGRCVGDSADNSEGHNFNGGMKLLEAQFSPLLAKSCRCSAILGGYDSAVQQLASDFAMHLSLAEQFNCLSVMEPLAATAQAVTATEAVVAAAGGFGAHVKAMETESDWRRAVIKTAHELCLHHSNQCLNLLQEFPINTATQELRNFIPILGNNCT